MAYYGSVVVIMVAFEQHMKQLQARIRQRIADRVRLFGSATDNNNSDNNNNDNTNNDNNNNDNNK